MSLLCTVELSGLRLTILRILGFKRPARGFSGHTIVNSLDIPAYAKDHRLSSENGAQCIPDGILSEAFEAADSGNWAEFLMVLSDPAPARKDLPIQLANEESNEIGKYGDPVGKAIIGVVANTVTLNTKMHQWSIMGIKQLEEFFKVAHWDMTASEPSDGGADAR